MKNAECAGRDLSNSDISDAGSIEVGDYVVAPIGKDNHQSLVVKVEFFAEEDALIPIEKAKHIIRKCKDDDFDPPEVI